MLKRKKKKAPANQQICEVFADNFPKGFDVEVDYNYLIIFDSNGKKVVDLAFDENGAIACAPKRKVGF